jgi:hypothetical protein
MSQVIHVDNKVNSIAADSNPLISDAGVNVSDEGVTLASGANVTLVENVSAGTITINANFGNSDPAGATNTLQINPNTSPPTFGAINLGTAYKLLGIDPTGVFNHYISLAGTSNQVIATSSGTTTTLSTPQSIGTGSSPTFAALTLSNPLTHANGGTDLAALGTAYKLLGVNSSATANTYLSLAGTSHQISVSPSGSAFTFATPQNIHAAATPTFQSLTASSVILNDTEGSPKTVTLSAPATVTNSWALTLPVNAGTNTYVLQTNGSGATSWFNPQTYSAGTGLTLTGTTFSLTHPIAISTGGTHLSTVGSAYQILGTNSLGTVFVDLTLSGTSNQVVLTESGSTIQFGTPQSIGTASNTTFAGLTLSGNLTLNNQGAVILNDTEGTPKSVTIEAPTTVTSSYSLALPIAQAPAGYCIQNDGSGNLSWRPGPTNIIVGRQSGTNIPSNQGVNYPSGANWLFTPPQDSINHMYIVYLSVFVSTGWIGGSYADVVIPSIRWVDITGYGLQAEPNSMGQSTSNYITNIPGSVPYIGYGGSAPLGQYVNFYVPIIALANTSQTVDSRVYIEITPTANNLNGKYSYCASAIQLF